MIAAGSGATPDARSDVVWLVQRMAASGGQRTDLAAFPLGFVLVERGTLVILGANGIPITELSSGRATLPPADERGSFGSANGDLVLYIQIVLVPVAAEPDTLPRGMLASDPFSAPHGATLGLELVRGIINPTRTTALPAGAMPALLLATDSAIQLETTSAGITDIPRGETFLLAEPATVRNPVQQPAMFVVARSVSTVGATTHRADQSGLDPALSDAWHHYGCHLKRPHSPISPPKVVLRQGVRQSARSKTDRMHGNGLCPISLLAPSPFSSPTSRAAPRRSATSLISRRDSTLGSPRCRRTSPPSECVPRTASAGSGRQRWTRLLQPTPQQAAG